MIAPITKKTAVIAGLTSDLVEATGIIAALLDDRSGLVSALTLARSAIQVPPSGTTAYRSYCEDMAFIDAALTNICNVQVQP